MNEREGGGSASNRRWWSVLWSSICMRFPIIHGLSSGCVHCIIRKTDQGQKGVKAHTDRLIMPLYEPNVQAALAAPCLTLIHSPRRPPPGRRTKGDFGVRCIVFERMMKGERGRGARSRPRSSLTAFAGIDLSAARADRQPHHQPISQVHQRSARPHSWPLLRA